MTFELKPDYEQVKRRYMAFWEREIADRPPVCVTLPKAVAKPFKGKAYACIDEKWLDVDARIDETAAALESTDFLYDSLPIAWPNLGPEIFSAWCGCPYGFAQTTAWSRPAISDWEKDFANTRLDMNHPLFKKMAEYTEKLIERGRGRFIVGLTDFHPGGDHIAALRGGQQLAVDLLENPEWVKKALSRAEGEYYAAYGVFYRMIHEAGMPTTSWTPLINDGTYYIPSNDFSCMVSREMFNEFFLPGIRRECAFYERSIYHLDGQGALRHLDALLEIPELDAVQWVCGAGNEGYHRWVDVYRRIQAAHKGIQMMCDIKELDLIFETLRPEGVWFSGISGIHDRETAEYAVKRIARWK
ncbi:MAG: hypothetical protein K5663_10195 [Clostridiales bacterium]|nr:hypothetical protein [Clostridiales bacterium]